MVLGVSTRYRVRRLQARTNSERRSARASQPSVMKQTVDMIILLISIRRLHFSKTWVLLPRAPPRRSAERRARRDGAQQRKGWGGRDALQGSWRVVLGCKPGSPEQLTACCCQALVHWRCSRHSSRWRSARSRGHLLLCAPPPHSVPFFHLDTLQGILTAVVDGVRGRDRLMVSRLVNRSPNRCARAMLATLLARNDQNDMCESAVAANLRPVYRQPAPAVGC